MHVMPYARPHNTPTGMEYARTLLVLSNVLRAQGQAEEAAAYRADALHVLQGEHMTRALEVVGAVQATVARGNRAIAAVQALEKQLMQ